MADGIGAASSQVAAANDALRRELPFGDREDFEDARRGFVATSDPLRIEAADGRTIWDMERYAFTHGDAPPTANPSLWRQAQLLSIHGLFEVAPGFYQVRGFDLSNMHLIEGETGVIVSDPLISTEAAAAALALYRAHRGDRPVTGLIYSHSHIDHFGGSRGILSDEQVAAGRVPVIAPSGFLEHAVSENVYAGTAMGRRAGYMFGALLEPGPAGQLTAGLGPTTSTGTVTLIPPTQHVVETGQEEVVDGVRFVFQLTPGTEAPSEMNFYFPDHKVLFVAENASHTLHNTLTLRGALVRDPRIWAHYLNETIERFGRDADVLFACHHWPRWGTERIVDYLSKQRDLYGYLHDQTLRLLNQGWTGIEIAERFELPPSLDQAWHCRGYYGSVSHNVKAVYQRYMGWFDGNPAHLWEHTTTEASTRYVDFMGGAEAVLAKARESFDAGDFRWVAQVVNHVVFAEPDNRAAKELQAAALEQLGYGAENGTWRNFFLTGAKELREGTLGTPTTTVAADIIVHLSLDQLLDSLAIRLDGPRAWNERIVINWTVGEQTCVTRLENGVLSHLLDRHADAPDATIEIPRAGLDKILLGVASPADLVAAGELRIGGDASALVTLLGLFDAPDPDFAIVTP
ncbi:alkyl/aryl-sulfatase [Conexibacter woesei]|uniref:Linear primary-alkylsulfatase n=1 Tax=Conexibacter woesei (strain DSM 14684 / CCUG 47730 / CIP 108061 / JCM 11494 / NBRC 100937 / ID131577) TaxID=469383 RepID=D3FDI6_CONWI|nr:alkyl sulfatase dimerization domain-containing protein [Conexibacter woesei]ADB49560.1 beta-lactamase domain protein [Conexibacter woesei DSM 14684]